MFNDDNDKWEFVLDWFSLQIIHRVIPPWFCCRTENLVIDDAPLYLLVKIKIYFAINVCKAKNTLTENLIDDWLLFSTVIWQFSSYAMTEIKEL